MSLSNITHQEYEFHQIVKQNCVKQTHRTGPKVLSSKQIPIKLGPNDNMQRA